MRQEILQPFLEKNKVLTSKIDLTQWKFDSYLKFGEDFREIPVLSHKKEDYKLVLLPAEYWNDTGPIFTITCKDGEITKPVQRRVYPHVEKKINEDKYQFLMTGSLDSPVYQEVLQK